MGDNTTNVINNIFLNIISFRLKSKLNTNYTAKLFNYSMLSLK